MVGFKRQHIARSGPREDGMHSMQSFTCVELTPQAFDSFSARHPQGNFQQASGMAAVRRSNGVDIQLLGIRKDDELVAAVQLEIHRSRLSTFAEVHDGPLCDFHDAALTRFLFDELKRRSREAGAAQLEITPELPYEIHDTEGRSLPAPDSGEPWPAGVPLGSPVGQDDTAFEAITGYGFRHAGFYQGYDAVPRWRYIKDLTGIKDEDALLSSYTKNTKRDVRLAATSCVHVERIGRDELPAFHAICELSCEKQGFENRELAYFQQLYDGLGDTAEFNIAFIDLRAYLTSWEEKRDAFQADIERLEQVLQATQAPRKVQKRLDDAREKHAGALKRIEEARRGIEEDGERVPAAGALFVWHPRECVYLFSGSDPKYAKFCAATAIQHHMMRSCVKRGVNRYNFYGIDGVFDDPKAPGRGLLDFKRGFNGYVEELMGSFTLPVKPAAYAVKQLAHKILGR